MRILIFDDSGAFPTFLNSLYRSDGKTAFNDFKTLDFVNRLQDRVMFNQTPRVDENRIDRDSFNAVLRTFPIRLKSSWLKYAPPREPVCFQQGFD